MLDRSGLSAEELEVTHDQHLIRLDEDDGKSSPNRSKVARRLHNLMPKMPRQKKPPTTNAHRSQNAPTSSRQLQIDSVSISSDNATAQSAEGQQSVQSTTNYTVGSHDTVRVSNRTELPEPVEEEEEEPKKSKRWSKIKRMMGVKMAPVELEDSTEGARSKDDTWKCQNSPPIGDPRKRIHSADGRPLRVRSTPVRTLKQQQRLDHSILGRLDGLDVLSLGPATLAAHAGVPGHSRLPWETAPTHKFSGQPVHQTPAQLVADMLWTSSGRSPPEMILEGFLPGGDDRWSVRFEHLPAKIRNPLSADQDVGECVTSEDGSPIMPTHKLWNMLWGPNPAPSNLTDLDMVEPYDEADDPLLNLAAENSIPIDIDEDVFIVSSREHLQSIYEITTVPLATGRFDTALKIFDKLLRGIEMLEDEDLRFLKGSVIHNIGVIQLWQGDFVGALGSFRHASAERSIHLPTNHADTVVSIVRKGMAYFALERFDEAIEVWNTALSMTQPDHAVRAKILNNLGVAHYHNGDLGSHSAALKDFTASLEIQRQWFQDLIRRETNVYDAAVTLGNMGKLYLEQTDYDLAYYVYEEALLLQTTIFRKDHEVVLASLTSLALAKARNVQLTKALQILKGCLRSQNVRFGADSMASVDTTGLMGYLYGRQKNFDEALKCLNKVEKWQSTRLSPSHPAMQATRAAASKLEESIDWV